MVKNLSAMRETRVQSLVRKIPLEGHGNPLLYSCLEISMEKGAWRATVRGVTKESDTSEQQHHTGEHTERWSEGLRPQSWERVRGRV